MPGKRVQIDDEIWHVLDVLARDRMMTFQELADEAFTDLLKKHDRPVTLKAALRRSARSDAGPQANSISRWRNRKVCQSGGTRNSFLRPHQTLAPVASTSFICSAFGGAWPRTLSASS